MGISIDDLNPETLKQLGLKKQRQVKFTVEQERQNAIACLNQIRSLSQAERGRVLRRAIKMNEA